MMCDVNHTNGSNQVVGLKSKICPGYSESNAPFKQHNSRRNVKPSAKRAADKSVFNSNHDFTYYY